MFLRLLNLNWIKKECKITKNFKYTCAHLLAPVQWKQRFCDSMKKAPSQHKYCQLFFILLPAQDLTIVDSISSLTCKLPSHIPVSGNVCVCILDTPCRSRTKGQQFFVHPFSHNRKLHTAPLKRIIQFVICFSAQCRVLIVRSHSVDINQYLRYFSFGLFFTPV